MLIIPATGAWAVDPRPAESPTKPAVQEEEEAGAGTEPAGKKTEQHAPTIEVGDTEKFFGNEPLSSPEKEGEEQLGDEWLY